MKMRDWLQPGRRVVSAEGEQAVFAVLKTGVRTILPLSEFTIVEIRDSFIRAKCGPLEFHLDPSELDEGWGPDQEQLDQLLTPGQTRVTTNGYYLIMALVGPKVHVRPLDKQTGRLGDLEILTIEDVVANSKPWPAELPHWVENRGMISFEGSEYTILWVDAPRSKIVLRRKESVERQEFSTSILSRCQPIHRKAPPPPPVKPGYYLEKQGVRYLVSRVLSDSIRVRDVSSDHLLGSWSWDTLSFQEISDYKVLSETGAPVLESTCEKCGEHGVLSCIEHKRVYKCACGHTWVYFNERLMRNRFDLMKEEDYGCSDKEQ